MEIPIARFHLMKNEENQDNQQGFPGFTEWNPIKTCGIENMFRIPAIEAIFIGHWETNFLYPLLVLFLMVFSYGLGCFVLFYYMSKGNIVILIILSTLLTMSLISYFKIIIDGPGYFQFSYPIEAPNLPSGILSTEAQESWVMKRPRPNRCIFSHKARRFVIRPDHYCDWTASWIGKRNNKHFILFNTWIVLYLIAFITIDMAGLVHLAEHQNSFIFLLLFIFSVIGIGFLFGVFATVISQVHHVIFNVTSWEEWNDISSNKYSKDCIRNFEDICGSSKHWCLWLIPVSPFSKYTNEELVENYLPYHDIEREHLSIEDRFETELAEL